MMTRKGVFVILAAMAASTQFAYEIRLEPDAAKRRTVSILKSQGPETAMLYLYAPAPWVIAGSAITAQDDNLWSGFNTTPNNYCHIYRMVNARSSQQFLTVFGQLTQPGDGYGVNPWFKATVPAVDIDWVNHSGMGHEDDEDSWTGFCPLTKVQGQRTKVVVRKLKDDRSLVSASMTLECWPTTAVRFLKEDGVTALWSGATVSDLETPLTLYVDPQASGPFTVTLKGPSDDASSRPTDYLTGKAVLLDLDVDADNNGAINDTDDSLEEDPGGILAAGAVKQVCLKLEPSGLTGTLTLSAVSGESRIRVWRDAGKSTPVALPAEWDLSGGYTFPTTVYVEGVAASSAARDVQFRLRYTVEDGNSYCDDDIRLTILKIDMITPAGDPVSAAVQSGDGQNEFTYSTASPGVLTMNMKAHVTPSGIANQIKDQCLFTVDTIAGSTLAWGAANPGGKPIASCDDLLATVTFTSLPANNTAFGNKKAAVYFNACKQDEENYEVFFPRNAANNPGGTDPNWFYYWGQVYVNANVYYVAAAAAGRVPAMTDWQYTGILAKSRIEIGTGHPAKGKPYGVGEEVSGIDCYISAVIHEEKHVAQIAAADVFLPSSGADSFRFGWSWNKTTHNHWTKGPDGQWGVAGTDDDGNGTVDDAAVAPPFEPGNGDDVCLSRIYASGYNNWPNAWTLPGGVYGPPRSPIEGEAVKASDDAMNENDYAPQDWGDPGKNHKTVNRWDD